MYFGEDYRKRNPERIKRLVSRRDTFFTNDMMYNTVSGILNAESNFYDGAEDISGENYRFTLEELWTFAHEVKVSDDPFLKNRP
jgi:heptose-I-phosphate ethanolaminephosphotransferase